MKIERRRKVKIRERKEREIMGRLERLGRVELMEASLTLRAPSLGGFRRLSYLINQCAMMSQMLKFRQCSPLFVKQMV